MDKFDTVVEGQKGATTKKTKIEEGENVEEEEEKEKE
jgi:hypothetical protein